MSLLKDFFNFAKSQGINKEDTYEERGEDYTIVSFLEQGEKDTVYSVMLILYDDNVVETYIRKQINTDDLLDTLSKVNNLNAEYRGLSFFIEDSVLSIKSLCDTNGDIEIALKEMVKNMSVSKTEFIKFTV